MLELVVHQRIVKQLKILLLGFVHVLAGIST